MSEPSPAAGRRRLLVVTDSFYPSEGGVERVVAESSRALRRLGHRVVILAGAEGGIPAGPERWADIDVPRYRFSARNTAVLNATATLAAARAVSHTIREHGPFELVHCHGVFGAAGVRLSPRGRRMPRVVTFHGPFDREFRLSQRSRTFPGRPVRRLLQGGFVPVYAAWLRALQAWPLQAATVVTLSRYTAGLAAVLLSARHAHGVHVVSGGVDLERFVPAGDRGRLRAALGLPVGARLLLTVRRLVPRMGLEALVQAMDEVRHHDPGVHLVIGGRGPLESVLRRQVASLDLARHVTLAGFLPEDALPRYYQCADLFVLSSTDLEGFGLVTLESLACGTPVLATRTGASAELLEELGDHALVDAPTAGQLAKGIVRFFEETAADPGVRDRCRRHVEGRYSWAGHAERLTALYEGVLERAGRAGGG